MGGRLEREEIYVSLQLIHDVVQQKLTHCKAVLYQEKIKINLKDNKDEHRFDRREIGFDGDDDDEFKKPAL